jgi:Ca2+-binding EF-hand superfamily protein
MTSALSVFDPTYSGYLDWRALLLALAAATFSPLHTATPAQLAAQALQLAEVDGDRDGKLTQQEFDQLRWWFEPRAELQEAAAAAPEQHVDVLKEVSR